MKKEAALLIGTVDISSGFKWWSEEWVRVQETLYLKRSSAAESYVTSMFAPVAVHVYQCCCSSVGVLYFCPSVCVGVPVHPCMLLCYQVRRGSCLLWVLACLCDTCVSAAFGTLPKSIGLSISQLIWTPVHDSSLKPWMCPMYPSLLPIPTSIFLKDSMPSKTVKSSWFDIYTPGHLICINHRPLLL